MLTKVKIINTNQVWDPKRRYRVNEVVNSSGNVYQNFTGGNSDPSLGTDWLFLKAISNVPVSYKQDFTADATQKFTVPSGIVIKNAFVNFVSVAAADWNQIGTEVTVTSSQVDDLITLTN